MKKYITDEKTGISYTLVGDVYLHTATGLPLTLTITIQEHYNGKNFLCR